MPQVIAGQVRDSSRHSGAGWEKTGYSL